MTIDLLREEGDMDEAVFELLVTDGIQDLQRRHWQSCFSEARKNYMASFTPNSFSAFR